MIVSSKHPFHARLWCRYGEITGCAGSSHKNDVLQTSCLSPEQNQHRRIMHIQLTLQREHSTHLSGFLPVYTKRCGACDRISRTAAGSLQDYRVPGTLLSQSCVLSWLPQRNVVSITPRLPQTNVMLRRSKLPQTKVDGKNAFLRLDHKGNRGLEALPRPRKTTDTRYITPWLQMRNSCCGIKERARHTYIWA